MKINGSLTFIGSKVGHNSDIEVQRWRKNKVLIFISKTKSNRMIKYKFYIFAHFFIIGEKI